MRVRERVSIVCWPGVGGGGGGEGGRLAPPRTGRAGSHAGEVTADLVALRERIAAITARPRVAGTSHAATSAFPSGGGQGGGAFKALPADCTEELTPFGPVVVRREWLPDEGDRETNALSTFLGLATDDLQRPLFLDTETTGLSGGTGTVAFLVGLAWREANGLTLAQYFLRDCNEANALLCAVGQCVNDAGELVSYYR